MLALYKNKILAAGMALVLFTSSVGPSAAQGLLISTAIGVLPMPGTMVEVSPTFAPPLLKGIRVFSDNPFHFEFILEHGRDWLSADDISSEANRLVRYFLASLTIPEKDMWVNLSPYEKDRIVPEAFGQTEMGRDLLAQDYLLKQITASVLHPEGDVGKTFWSEVYSRARQKYGTADIPMETFNKVWIVPEKAAIFENDGKAFIVESKLKVMLESDYELMKNAQGQQTHEGAVSVEAQEIGRDVIRDIVLPVLERDVNEGKNFAPLRQVYASLILAAWFKRKIKSELLENVYIDKSKISGVDVTDKNIDNKIYEQYLQAYKAGAYQVIKEDFDAFSDEILPKKYFSGGVLLDHMDAAMTAATGESLVVKAASSVVSMQVTPAKLSLDYVSIMHSATQFSERAGFDPGTILVGIDGSSRMVIGVSNEDDKVAVLMKKDEVWQVSFDNKVRTMALLMAGFYSTPEGYADQTEHKDLFVYLERLLDIKSTDYSLYERTLRLVAEALGVKIMLNDEPNSFNAPAAGKREVSYLSSEGLLVDIDEHELLAILANHFSSARLLNAVMMKVIEKYNLKTADYRLDILIKPIVAMEVNQVSINGKIEFELPEDGYTDLVINDRKLSFAFVDGDLLVMEGSDIIRTVNQKNPFYVFNDGNPKPFLVSVVNGRIVRISNQTDNVLVIQGRLNKVQSDVQNDINPLRKMGILLNEQALTVLSEKESLLQSLPALAIQDDARYRRTDEYVQRMSAFFEKLANGDGNELRRELTQSLVKIGAVRPETATRLIAVVMRGQLDNPRAMSAEERTLLYTVIFRDARIWKRANGQRVAFGSLFADAGGLLDGFFGQQKRPAFTLVFTEDQSDFLDKVVDHTSHSLQKWDTDSSIQNLSEKYADAKALTLANGYANGSPPSRTIFVRSDIGFEHILTSLIGEIGRQAFTVASPGQTYSQQARFILDGIADAFTDFTLGQLAGYRNGLNYYWMNLKQRFVATVMTMSPVERYGYIFVNLSRTGISLQRETVYFKALLNAVIGRVSLNSLSDIFFTTPSQKSKDAAQKPEATGGIDLDTARMNIDVKEGSTPVHFQMDAAMIAEWQNITGLVPVITQVSPLANAARYMGVEPGK